mgnify:CR=1 FL=1
MNKGNLRTQFQAILNRSDITTALADTFIDQGIARIQRNLRIASMEKQHNYTITSNTSSVALPSDFLEAIDIYFDNHMLDRISMKDMQKYKSQSFTGAPHYFAREQGSLLLFPIPTTGTLTLNYYAQFAEMTTDSDENALAAVASDLIMYAALTYAADYFLDERAQTFELKYQAFIAEIQSQSDDQELTGSLQTISPAYSLNY